jgi:hypothetical protein
MVRCLKLALSNTSDLCYFPCEALHATYKAEFGSACRGKWRDVEPDDKDLKRYHAWLQIHDGLSTGLERDALL